MSTLLIEGGRRLSGSVEVEGNKNAALPLLAACVLTAEECVLTNVPRIADVEAMARLLVDLGARLDGAPRSAAGPARARPARAAGRRFSRAPIDCDTSRCAVVHGRAHPSRTGPPAGRARRAQAGVHLLIRSVGHRDGDRA